MELPEALRDAVSRLAEREGAAQLAQDALVISQRYRALEGGRLLTERREAVAYAASRMPATYAAVSVALAELLARTDKRPRTLLDVGAGTGAAAWAAASALDLEKITCVERERAMAAIGKALMANGKGVLTRAEWAEREIAPGMPRAELVTAAYVLGELSHDTRAEAVRALWDATEELLLIVEPGTPAGFAGILAARDVLRSLGASVAAPCACAGECPNASGGWCHFGVRVQRSALHKRLKGGDAPFEDEKYAYIAVSREPVEPAETRVLRHPQVRGGHVALSLCTPDGIAEAVITKKDGEAYKKARKASWGDAL